MSRLILHSDCNNFFASVELIYHPELRGLPMAVAGSKERRSGIILAKNELAKSFGVKTAEAIWQAEQKCPDLVIVPPTFTRYLDYSKRVFDIYSEYTDQVEYFGLDECFLDVTGSVGLFGSGEKIAEEIRKRVKKEIGITVSIGVSYNKVFAKLGSDMKKPDAITLISRDNFKEKVWPLPVRDLLYIGPATERKLHIKGIYTIGNIAACDVSLLKTWMGKHGVMIWQYANGLDIAPVNQSTSERLAKSIGNSTTTAKDLESEDEVKKTLYILADRVATRMREQEMQSKTICLTIRYGDFRQTERQTTIDHFTCTSQILAETALMLYRECSDGSPVRKLGIGVSGLAHRMETQLSFLPEAKREQKLQDIEESVDKIRKKYGFSMVSKACLINEKSRKTLDPTNQDSLNAVAFKMG